jgi:hypothetical protein
MAGSSERRYVGELDSWGRRVWVDEGGAHRPLPYRGPGLPVPFAWGLGPFGLSWVLLAGALSAAGGAAYALRRPNPWPGTFAYHEVFHALVVAGISALYVVIAFYALPAAG